MELDSDIRRFIEAVARDAAAYPDPHSVSYTDSRRFVEAVRRRWTEGGPTMHRTVDLTVPTGNGPVRVRIHDPVPGAPKPTLVYLHGGGWTFFSLETHDRLMREYAARAGVVVVGVDYALAPEHRFPVALDQVTDVLRWLREHGHDVGVDPGRIAVGGDSAGANLAVAAALALRDAGEPGLVVGLVLNYGAYDARFSEAARRFGGDGSMLSSAEMETFWTNYVRSPADLADPLVCPLHADLAGLPPTFMAIAEQDLLTEQNQMMAVRFQAAGVPVRAVVYEGTVHSFLEAMSVAAVSGRALDDTADWLRRVLGTTSDQPTG